MKTEEILNIDCTKREGKEKIYRCLRKVKPLYRIAGDGEITNEVLETVLHGISIRYNYRAVQIAPYYEGKKFVFFKAEVCKKEDTTIWKGTVYGKTTWELLAKSIIKIYGEIKKESKQNE